MLESTPVTEKQGSPPADYYVVRTLGCKANLYDSQQIEAELQRRGWRPLPDAAEAKRLDSAPVPALCIVNSCTVTDEADRQSRRLASRLARENPRARVVVTGCGAEVDPERLARSVGIHYVVGNQDKPRLVDLVLGKLAVETAANATHAQDPSAANGSGEVLGSVLEYGELLSRHPMDREWPAVEIPTVHAGPSDHPNPATQTSKTRAFIKVQEGCNSFCTYCIIPYGRGPSRSLAPDALVAQVRELVARGARELVVTGTNIGDYGVDWGLDPARALPELFTRLLNETGIRRLRVGSLDPSEITPALLALAAREPRFCPHFHVSLQAAHPRVLRAMKRKYGLSEVRACLEGIARLPAPAGGAFAGMDVITGFPGETDEEFEAGFAELSSLPWSRLHVFPYSEREGTPATRLPGAVPPAVRAARARRLAELSLARVQAAAQRALTEARTDSSKSLPGVLLEKPQRKAPAGLSELSAELLARLLGDGPAGPVGTPPGHVWASGYTANYVRAWVCLPEAQAQALRNHEVSLEPLAVLIDRAQGDASLLGRLRPEQSSG